MVYISSVKLSDILVRSFSTVFYFYLVPEICTSGIPERHYLVNPEAEQTLVNGK